jgi:hypothetical protein
MPAAPESAEAESAVDTPVAAAPQPYDTYQLVIASFGEGEAPALAEDAVIRDVVGGLPGTDAPPAPAPQAAGPDTTQQSAAPVPPQDAPPSSMPETLPEPLRDSEPQRDAARDAALVAEIALEVADDATVPLDGLPKALAERVETLPPEDRPPLPPWIPAEAPDQPTLVGDAYPAEHLHGPSFVASIPVEPVVFAPAPERPAPETAAPPSEQPAAPAPLPAPPEPPAPAVPEATTPEPEETVLLHRPARAMPPEDVENPDLEEHDLSLTFAGLLPAEERPAEPLFGPASAPSPQPAPAEPSSRPPRAFRPQGPDAVASLALQLTQLSVESAAQFTLLSRADNIVAMAGSLSDQDTQALLGEIGHIWEGESADAASSSATAPRPARFRYMQLPGGGDFLLYSARTVENMALTMLFPGDVPLKLIRKQAAQLLELLERVPESTSAADAEPESPAETEAARTQPSRPTGMRAPEGLREALGALDESAEPERIIQAGAATDVALASFTFVWLPRKDELPAEIAGLVSGWLEEVSTGHGWRLESAQVQPTFVSAQLQLSAELGPAIALEVLMRETAVHAGDAGLWADASYIVAPAREVSDQEIAGLIEFRRESQGAAD